MLFKENLSIFHKLDGNVRILLLPKDNAILRKINHRTPIYFIKTYICFGAEVVCCKYYELTS